MSSERLCSYSTAQGPPLPSISSSDCHSSSRHVPIGLVSIRTIGTVCGSWIRSGTEAVSLPRRRGRRASTRHRKETNVPSRARGRPLGQKERELVPVGVGERPDLELLREEVLLEPDRDASRAQVPPRRQAEDPLLADELGSDVEPVGGAANLDRDRARILAAACPLDPSLDPSSPKGSAVSSAIVKARAPWGGSMPRN